MNKRTHSIIQLFPRKTVFILMLSLALIPMTQNVTQAGHFLSSVVKLMCKKLIGNMDGQLMKIENGLADLPPEQIGDEADLASSGGDPSSLGFYLQRIRLRVRPRASFQIPGLAQLRVAPYVEMEFRRENPRGLEDYQPR